MTTIAGISGGLAILLGAFGAHGLKKRIDDERLIRAFETGAHYHLAHSVGKTIEKSINNFNNIVCVLIFVVYHSFSFVGIGRFH
jgi:uncharacterized membrane protein YgdD (TMEM256/DUF423 family)